MLEERGHIPVVGVTPYLPAEIEEEDSLTERFSGKRAGKNRATIEIAVILMPRISNFTDFQAFALEEDVTLGFYAFGKS